MMTVQLELWHLITLLITFLSSMGVFAKVLFDQIEKRLAERFVAMEKAREAGSKEFRETLKQHMDHEERSMAQVQTLERDFLQWRAEMPLQYVRREDYIRNQTVIEAKLDALALRLENLQLRSTSHA